MVRLLMRLIVTGILGTMVLPTSFLTVVAAESTQLSIQAIERYKENIEHIGGVDRAAVLLSDGRRLKLPLFRAKPLAVLTAVDGSNFLLAEGARCTMCDEPTTLGFFPIGPGELVSSGERYPYPGRLREFMTNKLVRKTRFFYGRCVSEPGDVAIWYEEYVGEDSKWRKVNSIVTFSKKGESLTKMEPSDSSLASILRNVRENLCKELAGVDGSTEP